MARETGPVCRLCRREGTKLFLKAEKCYTDKCPVKKRGVPPGQHGLGRRKLSGYGLQLREKQKAKRYYGLMESQFRNNFERAQRSTGATGERMLQLLERRLDNVVYRMGLGGSRPESRQMVRHGHFLLNGTKASIPSMLVRPGDKISVVEGSRKNPRYENLQQLALGRVIPDWLEVDMDKLEGTFLRLPERAEIDTPVEEHMIVELYSR
ncbi:MAG: 30S ribosomal protein S4 [Sulfobacillus sp.]